LEDIIQIKDQFYVLATSALADDRTRVLKHGDTFAVFNRYGDIESVGLCEQGLYHGGTRHLSRFVVRLGDSPAQLLRSTIQDDNSCLTVDMMNLDIHNGGQVIVPRGAMHLFRSQFLWEDTCYEQLRISNFSLHSVETRVAVDFRADFVDIFQVRGAKREKTGSMLPVRIDENSVVLSYQGRDGKVRRTCLSFSPAPARLTQDSAEFVASLERKREQVFYITVRCEHEHAGRKLFSFDRARNEMMRVLDQERLRFCKVETSSFRFNSWLARSESDLQMMVAGNPEQGYPYAGVPWFNTVFGRDGILTARECLWVAPWMAKGVLRFLAETQATEVVADEEAEPGKILHEMRRGEMASLKEIPFGRYYGAVDTTPLFVLLAGAYLDRTDDHAFIRAIWPNILAALDWIDKYGDSDQDGFVEYRARSSKGLVQQGWKDSHDSVFHQDGSLADPPIALCEVQGYVYAAKRAAAKIAARFEQPELSARLLAEVEELQKRFEREFWDDDLNTYVLALDRQKQPCRVQTSNAGHCLFAGIASREHAARVADTLLTEQLFCGWGIRTVGSGEARYNPMSYHNGSVWPHDSALVARGLASYGFKKEALAIFRGLLEASVYMELNRLPELFCGFHRRSAVEGPTLYPVACSPQAWASGSIYLLLEACLGLEINPKENSIQLGSPHLPDFLEELRLENLQLGDQLIDLIVRGRGNEVSAEIVRGRGKVRIESRS
jgi:glycogen debranching enzyme